MGHAAEVLRLFRMGALQPATTSTLTSGYAEGDTRGYFQRFERGQMKLRIDV